MVDDDFCRYCYDCKDAVDACKVDMDRYVYAYHNVTRKFILRLKKKTKIIIMSVMMLGRKMDDSIIVVEIVVAVVVELIP